MKENNKSKENENRKNIKQTKTKKTKTQSNLMPAIDVGSKEFKDFRRKQLEKIKPSEPEDLETSEAEESVSNKEFEILFPSVDEEYCCTLCDADLTSLNALEAHFQFNH